MKLFIDDLRDPPNIEWVTVRTPEEAISVIELNKNDLEAISFDHDLGVDLDGNELNSRGIIIYMIENNIKANSYIVHSANPVGVEWLTGMINRYLK